MLMHDETLEDFFGKELFIISIR